MSYTHFTNNKKLNKSQRAERAAANHEAWLLDTQVTYQEAIKDGEFNESPESLIKRMDGVRYAAASATTVVDDIGVTRWESSTWWYAARDFERVSDSITAQVVKDFMAVTKEVIDSGIPSGELVARYELLKQAQEIAFNINYIERDLAKQVRRKLAHVSSLVLVKRKPLSQTVGNTADIPF